MKIDSDVRCVSSFFGVDPALVQAVVAAEGDIVRAVRCSYPMSMNSIRPSPFDSRARGRIIASRSRMISGRHFVSTFRPSDPRPAHRRRLGRTASWPRRAVVLRGI